MKYYKVPEDEMRELVYDSMKLAALENGGIDNWGYYGDSIDAFEEANGEDLESIVERAMKEDYLCENYS